jgi:prevent-host-death family protein
MTSVGIRELRQKASELLRLVEAGETIEITDRGRPVALLKPIPELSNLEKLRALGEVESADQTLGKFPQPVNLDPDLELPSVILARLRRDER